MRTISLCLVSLMVCATAPAQQTASAVVPGASAESLGMSSERVARIDALAKAMVERGERAGLAVIVARHGKIVLASQHGLRDIANKKPMQLDTLVRAYSMTKPVTSVAVMMLYEQGRFQLDDPIGRYLPELAQLQVLEKQADGSFKRVPAKPSITIHQLLTHTSGLAYNYPPQAGYRRDDVLGQSHTLAEMIPQLAKVPLLYQPGEGWSYSTSTDVLARLVEVLSGMSFDRFLSEHLFSPLQMNDSMLRVPTALRDRFAEVYTADANGKLVLATQLAPKSGPFDTDGRFLAGGGALVTTALDYWRFCQMLLNGGQLDGVRILASETVRYMTINHVPLEYLPPKFAGPGGAELFAGYGFGLGFAVLLDPAKHGVAGPAGIFRWGGLANTLFWIDPKTDLCVVVMSQHLPTAASRIERDFQALVYQAVTD